MAEVAEVAGLPGSRRFSQIGKVVKGQQMNPSGTRIHLTAFILIYIKLYNHNFG